MHCSEVERCPAAQVVGSGNIASEEQQSLHHLPVPMPTGLHQRRLATIVPRIHLGAFLEQQHNNLVVALGGGEVEWGVEATKSGVLSEAGVKLQQHPGLHQIAVPGRRDQPLAGGRAAQRVPHRIPDADSISAVQAVMHYLSRPRQPWLYRARFRLGGHTVWERSGDPLTDEGEGDGLSFAYTEALPLR